jgi:hypothetical protein
MLKPPILTMTVSMWNRKKGDPTARTPDGVPFKGKFPAGTFVFPFEFAALPLDTLVKHPDEERRKVDMLYLYIAFPDSFFRTKPECPFRVSLLRPHSPWPC